MASLDEQILRTAKEIVVKFIEGGRITPTGFTETFRNVYKTVDETVKESVQASQSPNAPQPNSGQKPHSP